MVNLCIQYCLGTAGSNYMLAVLAAELIRLLSFRGTAPHLEWKPCMQHGLLVTLAWWSSPTVLAFYAPAKSSNVRTHVPASR